MKNKLMIFAVLTMCLCMGTQAWAANLVIDPGFDLGVGGQLPAGTPPDWTTAGGTDGWHHADSVGLVDRYQGTFAIKLWGTGTTVYQDIAISAGNPYNFGAEILSPTAPNPWGGSDQLTGGRDAIIRIQWFNSGSEQIGPDEIVGRFVGGVDADDVWVPIGDLSVAPSGAVTVRFHIAIEDVSSSIGAPNFEACSVETAIHPTKASGGSPNGGFANPDTTTELTWVNPIATPALTEIYFVESTTPLDPNETHPTSAKAALDASSLYDSCTDACTSSAVALTLSKYYAWRVVCDSNSSDDWIFDTFNTAPTADAGLDQNAWLVSGTVDVDLDGTGTDPGGYPGTPLTYTWTQTAGASVGAVASVANPTVTMTAADTYTFELVVGDGIDDSDADTVTVEVFAEADDRKVAHWSFEDNLDESVNATDPTSETWTGKTPLGPTDLDGTAGGVSAIAYVNGITAENGSVKALSLDGTNWVEIAVDPNWLHFDDEITVSAWVRGNGVSFGPQWAGIVTKGDSSWRIAVDGGGQSAEMACGLYGNDDFSAIAGTQIVNNGTWKHIVGTYDSETIAIYIDGILDTTAVVSDPIAKNDYRVRIGANAEHAPPRAIEADIDEVRIFDRALSAARVLAMYAADGGGAACGQDYADSDFTEDCKTDGDDLRVMIIEWLDCTDLTGVNCGN